MSIRNRLSEFNKKSLRTKGISGSLITISTVLTIFILAVILEYTFWFDRGTRTILFFLLLCVTAYLFYFKIVIPILKLLGILPNPKEEELAAELNQKLPEIKDDLINYLQLERQQQNSLTQASLDQKSSRLGNVDFLKAVDIKIRKKNTKILGVVLVVFSLLALVNPPLISGGTERLVNYNKEFVRPAPFKFIILNDSLKGFRNKDFRLDIQLAGVNAPGELQIITDQSSIKLKPQDGHFLHTFKSVADDLEFQLEASGYYSQSYQLEIMDKPQLNLMSVQFDYPDHIENQGSNTTSNGNFSVPAGSRVTWTLSSKYTEEAFFNFQDDTISSKRIDENSFELTRSINESGEYSIDLSNKYGGNESLLSYRMSVIPDEHPGIEVSYLPDTAFFKYVITEGIINDDHGFSSLSLITEVNEKIFTKKIEINRRSKQQSFFIEWYADSFNIKPSDKLRMYLVVKDNDALAGYKSSRSAVFEFKKPDLSELSDMIEKKSEGAERQIEKSLKETERLRNLLDELSKRMKSEKEAGWQEEKLIEESLEAREELEKMLQDLKKKHDDLIKANQNFQQSKQLEEKSENLNEIIDDLMDDETKKLYEELKKLLQENGNSEKIREKFEEISRQENRMFKDLKRTKELFKRFKVESGLERLAQQLDSLASKQMKLSEQELDSASESAQEEIQEEFEELSEDLNEIEELNQELDNPEPLEDFDSDEKQINNELQKAMEEMKKGDSKKSKKNQQGAAQQMNQMSKKMQKMMAGMEAEMMQANIEHLRKILDDLVRLSYKQENLINDFKGVNSSDPRFVSLSQDQVKLQEDLVIIEDSLLSLANRVAQLSSFITKEVDEINHHMDESVTQIRERQRGRALSHQQFSMTSMNNLALLLNDVLQNMQMTMSESMGKGSGKQPQDMPLPSLGEMQKQLGDKMKSLSEDGKSGRELSEELARLAAEQEMIRQQLQRMQEQLDGQFGNDDVSNKLSQAIKMMEDNEVDLVNKRISQRLIERQKQITTRLLEADDALREQDQDEEREGETAQQRNRIFPPSFEEYLKQRKKEIELLQSVPIELKPFYKKEVNDYFRRLSEDQ